MKFAEGRGAEATTTDVLDGVRMDGKHVLVTGGTGGLGLETARALGSVGASLTITGRSQEKLDAAVATLAEQVPEASVRRVMLDLASLASIATGAQTILEGDSIDVQINNAGVMMCPLSRTADGFEMQTGTNHLGHFALSAQIQNALTDDARLVSVSSAAHLRGTVDLTDLNWNTRDYDKMEAYSQSKTANIWFASELQRRRPNLLVSSLHPGAIVTDLGRHLTKDDMKQMQAKADDNGGPMIFKSIPAGAATSVWAASSSELVGHGGAYLADCHVVPPVDESYDPRAGYAPWAMDAAGAAALWEQSLELTGVEY